MKDLREEIGTEARIVDKIDNMDVAEARMLQKTRKTTDEMGGLPEEKYIRKTADEEKWREKTNDRGVMKHRPHPYNRDMRGRTMHLYL